MKKNIQMLIAMISLTLMTFGAQAAIGPSQVQYSTNGSGNYNINAIDTFDFDDTASAVWSQNLVASSNGQTTLSGFFGNAVAGDTFTFDFNYQSTLVAFNQSGVAPTSSTTPSGFEVTAVTTGQITAQVGVDFGSGSLLIAFTGITGTYQLYHDSNAATASDNLAGTGFTDGTKILEGSLGAGTPAGSYTSNANSGGAGAGSIFFSNNINFIDNSYIAADPLSNAPLLGTTIDSTINFNFGTAPAITNGASIGVSGYTVQVGDLKLSGDGTYGFIGSDNKRRVPEPSAIFLLGGGLMMMGGFLKKRKA